MVSASVASDFGIFVITDSELGCRRCECSRDGDELAGAVDNEAVHTVEQIAGKFEHLFGGGGQFSGTGSGLLNQFTHLVHGADNGLRAGCLFFDGRIDLLCNFGETVGSLGDLRRADGLFVRGGADFLGELVDFGDDVGNFVESGAEIVAEAQAFFHDSRAALHVFDGLASLALDALNQVGDFLGGLRGFFRQLADFVGDDGEAEAVFTGARGFDGGVQSQQVGLFGKVVNDFDDLADVVGAMAEDVDDLRGRLDGAVGAVQPVRGLLHRLRYR